ncbi:hypothetical protein EDC50_3001 [Vulcaniibacterium tengchongense]|uniref:Uncharacterized protein n=2 Tax=Vulcaniibacterium tengchongense TaxID=1273429 RepID=A0A3N4UXE9_9GAMM|nr:hypothetical protein EDC50_3001 [Vulcaniibacterium tengchongense]
MLAACGRAPNAKEVETIKDMTSTMRTQCVGRFVIIRADGAKIHGVTDAMGNIDLQKGLGPETLSLDILDEAEGGMS